MTTIAISSPFPSYSIRKQRTEAEWIEIEKNRYKTWYKGSGIILFNAEGRILLVQDAVSKKWSFPKGHVEEEDYDIPLLTAIRETTEEVGLNPMTDYTFKSFTPIKMRYDVYYFMATLLDTANPPRIDRENECAYRWCSRDEIKRFMWKHSNLYIKQFVTDFWFW